MSHSRHLIVFHSWTHPLWSMFQDVLPSYILCYHQTVTPVAWRAFPDLGSLCDWRTIWGWYLSPLFQRLINLVLPMWFQAADPLTHRNLRADHQPWVPVSPTNLHRPRGASQGNPQLKPGMSCSIINIHAGCIQTWDSQADPWTKPLSGWKLQLWISTGIQHGCYCTWGYFIRHPSQRCLHDQQE